MKTVVVPEQWTPAWAPKYVTATYTPLVREPVTGLVEEPQHVRCHCANCDTHWQTECSTGAARNHIQTFCRVHSNCRKVGGQ